MAHLSLAFALLAGVSQASPLPSMESVGTTANCNPDPNNISMDCGMEVESIFKAIKPVAIRGRTNLANTQFRYFASMQGVSVNCEQGGSAFESFSPASAEDCGGKTNPFIAAGHGIWSMAGACRSGGFDSGVNPSEAVAFVLLHEFAHLRLNHAQLARKDLGEFCMKQWFPHWINTPDAEKVLKPIIDKHGKGNPAQLQKAAAFASLRHCADLWGEWGGDSQKVPAQIRIPWMKLRTDGQQRELDADAEAKLLVIEYNQLAAKNAENSGNPLPSISVGAGQCTMLNLKGLQDAWASSYKMAKPPVSYVSSHPESDTRAEKLAILEEQLCGSGRAPGSICAPALMTMGP